MLGSKFIILAFFFVISSFVSADTPAPAKHRTALTPVSSESPRETVRSFMNAMNLYRKGVETNNAQLVENLQDAMSTLDVSEIPLLVRNETARDAAKLLKEVLDRVIVFNYEDIPSSSYEESQLERWRVPNTEIFVVRISQGERTGEYLFSSNTVRRVPQFYSRVKDLPYLEGSGQGALYTDPWQDTFFPEWARDVVLGYTYWQWIGLFIIIFLGLLARLMAKITLVSLKGLTTKTSTQWDQRLVQSLEKPMSWIVLGLFWMLSVHLLRFDGAALAFMMGSIRIILSVGFIWAAYSLTDLLVAYIRSWAGKKNTTIDENIIPLVHKALKVFVLVVGVLVALQNMGVNVFSLLAGLGLGGLAFALAAKDTAANLFGSLMIFFDKPFKVGDWINVNGQEGIVEAIGFRSTRIRTFYDSQVSIPNSVVANLNIDNFGRRRFRRVLARLGVTYDTSPERLEAFVEGIKKIILDHPLSRKENYHVVFNSYGDYNLEVMVYFFLKVPDWATELIERQNIYFKIYKLASELGVEFAFPTQTVHLASETSQKRLQ